MYNKDGPLRIGVEMWVINRLHYFRTKYIATKTKIDFNLLAFHNKLFDYLLDVFF
jgi:hypothetical protein